MAGAVNPYDKAHDLARAITGSEIYERYLIAKNAVEENPEYQEIIANIRNKQMEVNKAKLLGEEVDKDTVLDISMQFAKANQIPEIADFFNAESSFIQMFNDIMEILQKAIQVGFE